MKSHNISLNGGTVNKKLRSANTKAEEDNPNLGIIPKNNNFSI